MMVMVGESQSINYDSSFVFLKGFKVSSCLTGGEAVKRCLVEALLES